MFESNVFFAVVVFGTILISMTLHEAMHAFMGYWLGDDTAKMQGRLTLNPIKHIDPMLTLAMPVMLALIGAPIIGAAKPVPFNPARVKFEEFGAALVGLAGPMTNLLLAIAMAGVVRLTGVTEDSLAGFIMITFIFVNIIFFVFNMIPWPPLDGSRVLYAVAPAPLQKIMYQIESFGIMGLVLFLVLMLSVVGPIVFTITQSIVNFLI